MSPTYYRCRWKQQHDGSVSVDVENVTTKQKPAGFYVTEADARLAEAWAMQRLAGELSVAARRITEFSRNLTAWP